MTVIEGMTFLEALFVVLSGILLGSILGLTLGYIIANFLFKVIHKR